MGDFSRMTGPDDFGKAKNFADGRRKTVPGIDRNTIYDVLANDGLFHRQSLGIGLFHAAGQ
jgi:hypothetical protein